MLHQFQDHKWARISDIYPMKNENIIGLHELELSNLSDLEAAE